MANKIANTETRRQWALKHVGTDHQCTAMAEDTGARCGRNVVKVKSGQDIVYGTVCGLHGGARQKASLINQLREKKVERVAKRIGSPVRVDPAEAILQQVWEAAGNVAFLRERVRMLQTPLDLDPRIQFPELFGAVEDPSKKRGPGRPRKNPVDETKANGNGNSDPDSLDLSNNGSLVFDQITTGAPIANPSIYGPDHLGDLSPHVLLKMYDGERDRLVRIAKVAIDCGIAERQQRLAEGQAILIAQVVLRVLEGLALDPEKIAMGRRIAASTLRDYEAKSNGTYQALESPKLDAN